MNKIFTFFNEFICFMQKEQKINFKLISSTIISISQKVNLFCFQNLLLYNHRTMNQTVNTQKFTLTKQNSVDILFKGLKRNISQRSYSKIKNSYKKKPIEINELKTTQSFIPAQTNRTKLKLSVVSNKITDPEIAYDELIKLKQTNHKLFQENTQLLRKIRKEQKIEQIYKKKLQGHQLIDLQYFKILQIKLLLEVQRLQNELEDREIIYEGKLKAIKTKKNLFKDQIVQKRIQVYGYMINNPNELKKKLKQKKFLLDKNLQKIDMFRQKLSKVKAKKQQQTDIMNQVNTEIKDLKEKFRVEEKMIKRTDSKSNSEMLNITNMMSSLLEGSQKSQPNKQSSTAMIKNNMSSISIKNKNSIQEIEKQILRIKQEYDMINNQIQEFMDEKIKQKLLIKKEIFAIEEVYKSERQDENMKMIYENSSLGKKKDPSNATSRVITTNNKSSFMKSSLVVSP